MSVLENITWDKIVIPVVVALITTLVVEYFAKPRLEARKQRLIRDRQQIDEVIFQFQKVSSSIAALLPDDLRDTHIKEGHNKIMLNNASGGLYALMDAMSRLSHTYAEKHQTHIGNTMIFIGYLLSKVEAKRTAKTMTIPIDDLKKDAANLEYFDVYFVANVGLKDSQERWAKRIYWRLFDKNNANQKTTEILEAYKLTKVST